MDVAFLKYMQMRIEKVASGEILSFGRYYALGDCPMYWKLHCISNYLEHWQFTLLKTSFDSSCTERPPFICSFELWRRME